MLVFESTARLLGLQRRPQMYSPQTQSRIAHLRARCADGSITAEELREGVKLMREDRYSALTAQANKPAGAKARKAPVNVGALFDSLDKL